MENEDVILSLTTLNLAHILREEKLVVPTTKATKEQEAVLEVWNHCDLLCRNYSLNGLEDILYNVYSTFNTADELWESLEKKYKIEDAGTKKFIVGLFLDYMMVDSIPVVKQLEHLQVIINQIHMERMAISEPFQVASIIEMLPPLWNAFKNYLKHKCKELLIKDLIV